MQDTRLAIAIDGDDDDNNDNDDDDDFAIPVDGTEPDDLACALADLAKLRASVRDNLRLRPIRSFSALPKQSSSSRSSLSPSPVYHTPDQVPSVPDPPARALPPSAWPPDVFSDRLSAPKRPIVVDTRPLAAYHASHLSDSVNIAIPSLILKRCRKPGSGFQSLAALRQFITSDQDKHRWDSLPSSPSWNGDVVIVHGEETDDSEIGNLQVTAWALLSVISSLLGQDRVHYLRGGIAAAQSHPILRNYLVTQTLHPPDPDDGQPFRNAKIRGLFHLNTSPQTQTCFEIDQPIPSPSPVMPTTTSDHLNDTNASPPPAHLSFRRPAPPRRPSAPNLTRIITNGGGEQQLSLPRLQIRTAPTRSATLPITPSQFSGLSGSPNGHTLYLPPQSPSHLNLLHSNHTPPVTSPRWTTSPAEFLPPPSPRFARPTPPRTPDTPQGIPRPSPSPSTARPDDLQTATTESEFPTFTVSMILPNFLYLGPELTLPEHVQELKSLGIKRILNIAAECNDDHALNLSRNFERYVKIPMRDTVEEDQITRGLREACEILDEANLYGASTYVHCKAGKSRSVTAVMAYLIHANHWTLSRAYAFVLERRKGISPNIGFVSELMTFEEQELGGKSVGVVPVNSGHSDGGDSQTNHAYAAQSRRPGHARESLPPMVTVQDPDEVGEVAVGQDMEIKDKEGRYRHMRRAPVDENTLQPMRRVSKAGLESGLYTQHAKENVKGQLRRGMKQGM
ncbi:hypothetical protein JVT61DRAFT_4627 [Boletus reticuloceps]|uniref:protein-tyrosine-phosphatase n=1 Tax=Boletus reticuloceps TaxID=495285 RepID=A0A8I2YMP5_9AGAM|nr:hypothetical protein JVT61DRAFT_4627 [Boletus reticuloceps]